MKSDPDLVRAQSIGRAAFWLVLAILAGSVLYIAGIAIANWNAISV